MNTKPNKEEISHIKRREIQAPLVTSILKGFIDEIGEEKTIQILSKVIEKDAIESGRVLAEKFGGNSVTELSRVVKEYWCDEGAMEIEVLKENENEFQFNVTKCQYAEIYKKLNVTDLGTCLSCERDFSFNNGFNPEIKLKRSKTIMEGEDICDFRYFKSNVK